MVAWLRWTVLVAGVLSARGAVAQPALAEPLRLTLAGDAVARFDGERTRARLAAETGRPVMLDDRVPRGASGSAALVTITYRAGENELTVRHAPITGDAVTRTIVVGAGGDALEAAILLAGNLVRDQASELLAAPAAVADEGAAAPAPRPTDITLGTRAPRADDPAMQPAARGPDVIPVAASAGRARTAVAGVRLAPTPPPWPSLPPVDRIEAAAWAGNLTLMNIGLRFSGRYVFALVNASAHVENDRRMVGPGMAIGVRYPWRQLAGEADIGTTFLYGLDWPAQSPDGFSPVYTSTRFVSRLRWSVALAPTRRFALFVGASAAVVTHMYGSPDNERGREVFGGIRL